MKKYSTKTKMPVFNEKNVKPKARVSLSRKLGIMVEISLLMYMGAAALRNFNIIEKPNYYVNNEQIIQNNLNILGIDDSLFVKSPLNNEINVNMNKNLKVSINSNLDKKYIESAKEAVEYMNYVLQGLNPEYSISFEEYDLNLENVDNNIVISFYDGHTDFIKGLTAMSGVDIEEQNALMFESSTFGLFNHNGIYKSHIHVNTEYLDELHKNNYSNDGFHDYCTTIFIHELCHCLFGFDDVATKETSIMDYNELHDYKCMYAYDLFNAAASICNLQNQEEKLRAYNFISNELIRQVRTGVYSKAYRYVLSK